MNKKQSQQSEQTASLKVWTVTIILAVAIIAGAYYLRAKQEQGTNQPITTASVGEKELNAGVKKPAASEPVVKKAASGAQTASLDDAKLAGTLELTVPVLWPDNNRLPLEHSCHRKNISFPVTWAGAPKKTQSFVLMMDKIPGSDEKEAKAYNYWLLYNIPADSAGLKADMPKGPELENGTRYGRNDHGVVQYTGPCDPRGKVNYRLTLVALDTTLPLMAGANKDALYEAMAGHVIDKAEQPILHYLRF